MKKRILISVFIVFCMLFIATLSSCGSTSDNTSTKDDYSDNSIDKKGEFEYRIKDDGTYEIAGIGTVSESDIIIPSTYRGIPVTAIADAAFYGEKGITSIIIPNSITSIGFYAFKGCGKLTSVIFENTDKWYVLQNKDATSGIVFDVTGGASRTAAYLKSIYCDYYWKLGTDMPNTATKPDTDTTTDTTTDTGKDDNANNDNKECRHTSVKWVVDFDATCTTYGFRHKECLECHLTIETQKIEAKGHKEVVIKAVKATCTETGLTEGKRCSVCNEITVKQETVQAIGHNYVNGVCKNCGDKGKASEGLTFSLNVGGKSYSVSGIGTCKDIYIVIPYTYNDLPVTGIGDKAFYECSDFASITIHNGITSIGYSAFQGCTGLASVTIPDSVTSIGNSAFSGCTGLTSVTIPNSVTSISYNAFYNCSNLNAVYIEDISAWCKITFSNSTSNPLYYAKNLYLNNKLVKGLVIPSDITEIKDYTFVGGNFTKVTIHNNVTSIDEYAFYDCSSLTSIVIPNSVTSIGECAFRNCTGLTSVTIPNSVKSIGGSVFQDCTGLTSVTIPNSVTSIDYGAFQGCTGLTSVTIPNSVTSIGISAFQGCTGLTSVTIPNSVTSIGISAFQGCTGLTSVTIPNSVTSINYRAFQGCSNLKSITLPFVGSSSNGTYHFGYIFGASSHYENYSYVPSSLKTVVITGGNSISQSAFYGCNLESLTLPFVGASLTETYFTNFGYIFGASSYSYNSEYVPSSLKTVVITGGNSINWRAFSGCSNLTSITIPNTVTSIGNYAFSGCSSLRSITIPDSVTSIDIYAFSGCNSLTSVTFKNTKGWYVSINGTIIDVDITNPSTAAQYLSSKYRTYKWGRR